MVVLSVVDENLTFYTSHCAFKKANSLTGNSLFSVNLELFF